MQQWSQWSQSVHFKIIRHPSPFCVSVYIAFVQYMEGGNINILYKARKMFRIISIRKCTTYSCEPQKSVYSFQVSTSKLWHVQCIHSFLPTTKLNGNNAIAIVALQAFC